MKRVLIWAVAVSALGGCSHVTQVSGAKTVEFTSLSEDSAPLAEAFKAGDGMVVHVKKGDEVPVELTASLPFGTLAAGDNRLVASEDFYLYVSPKEGVMIGRDGVRFASVGDMKGIKKVFGFSGGQVRVGFFASAETPSHLQVSVAAHP